MIYLNQLPVYRGIVFWCALLLAGCGGESGGGNTTPPVDYLSYQTQSASLHATWDGSPVTDPATLPISGTAGFTGVIDLTLQAGSGELDMSGKLALTANFNASTIVGSATGFVTENSDILSGSLAATGGVIDPTAIPSVEYTYGAILAGTLSGGGETYGITADLSGDFLGPDQMATIGVVAGTATSGFGSGYVFGEFIAEQ